MPSPSVNRAVDIVLATFPGSEVITPDTTKRHVPQAGDKPVDKGKLADLPGTKKPPPKRRGLKPGKNQEGLF